MIYEFFIKGKDEDKRLDIFLTERAGKLSRSQWQKRIKAGKVLVNGKEKVVPHYKLRQNDKVEIPNFKYQAPNKFQITNSKLQKVKVVFESDDYVVINKPAGVVVHPDAVNKEGTLINWLIEKYPEIENIKDLASPKGGENLRPGIVHRLDKDVSGLMVVARNQVVFDSLKKQFQNRKVLKEYMALVHNQMRQDEGEVKLPIGRSKKKGVFVAMANVLEGLLGGRQATTRYEVVKRFKKKFTLIKVKTLTGRTHQIRVHLRSIGYPVVGDKLYETHDVRLKKKGVDLGRLWLYAAKLGFRDLIGEWQEFEIKTPQELEIFLTKIK